MKTTRLLAALTALLIASGCATVLGDDQGSFTFESELIQPGQNGLPPEGAQVSGRVRGIQVDGVIALPSPCQEIHHDVDQSAATIVLTVTATALPGTCPGVTSAAEYSFQGINFSQGVYRVRVQHVTGGPAGRIITTQDVRVD